ncbi:MAG: oxygenase MpaB family protein [Actinomycetota bacterium]
MLDVLRGFPRAAPAGRPGDPGLFGPDSVAWKVNSETALLLGAGRALLLQLAHPGVAAGVADHSGFPRRAFPRLWRTLETSLTISFGDAEQSAQAAERVNAVHRRVHGATYDALDPELLIWVHATLVDSALVAHDRFVGGLSGSDRERYYREMKRQAAAFEIPGAVLPGNLGDFRRYVRKQLPRLRVTEEARMLAADVLSPPVPLYLRPAAMAFRQVTIGLLPPAAREAYGLRWGRMRESALAGGSATIRAMLPAVPNVLRHWPQARAAGRRVAADADAVPQKGRSALAR